jgi:hypothetical protein
MCTRRRKAPPGFFGVFTIIYKAARSAAGDLLGYSLPYIRRREAPPEKNPVFDAHITRFLGKNWGSGNLGECGKWEVESGKGKEVLLS